MKLSEVFNQPIFSEDYAVKISEIIDKFIDQFFEAIEKIREIFEKSLTAFDELLDKCFIISEKRLGYFNKRRKRALTKGADKYYSMKAKENHRTFRHIYCARSNC